MTAPGKAYQNLDGLDAAQSPRANDNIARMAESIIRHQVANSTIAEVITNRSAMRKAIRDEMQEVVKGWGVWLETVEITDVVILSQSLFEDLQAEYRQETHKQAEEIRMDTAREIEQMQIAQDLGLRKQRTDASMDHRAYEAEKELDAARREAELLEEQIRLQKNRLAQEQEVRQLEQSHEMTLALEANEHEIDLARARLELEQTMSDNNMKLAILGKISDLYDSLPLEQVKLVNTGPGMGIESLMTQLMAALGEVNASA